MENAEKAVNASNTSSKAANAAQAWTVDGAEIHLKAVAQSIQTDLLICTIWQSTMQARPWRAI